MPYLLVLLFLYGKYNIVPFIIVSVVICRSDKAGKLLADVLLKELQGQRYTC